MDCMNDAHTLQVRTPTQPHEVYIICITNAHTSCPMHDTPTLALRSKPVLRCFHSRFTLMVEMQIETAEIGLAT